MAAPVVTSSPVTMPTRMWAAWASATAALDSSPGPIDHGDQAPNLEVGAVGEQVAGRVEVGRVQVPHRGRHDPPALACHSFEV
jgi:hypothetical protein